MPSVPCVRVQLLGALDVPRFHPFPAQEIVTPLSTGRIWPVTMRDSSDAR